AATGIPVFALDLRHIPADGPVAAWMADKPHQRSIGGLFDPEKELVFVDKADPRDNFDVVVFVESTTAARGIKRPPSIVGGPLKPNPEPTNLAFTNGTGTPDGWYVFNDEISPYAVTIEDGVSPSGGRAVRIGRSSSTLPWGDAVLCQFLDAAPWRGRRMVFSAAMRADAPWIGTGAVLAIHVYRKREANRLVFPIAAIQAGGVGRSSRGGRPPAAGGISAPAPTRPNSPAPTRHPGRPGRRPS